MNTDYSLRFMNTLQIVLMSEANNLWQFIFSKLYNIICESVALILVAE
jgi:hypothetical protein